MLDLFRLLDTDGEGERLCCRNVVVVITYLGLTC